jgi:DNA-binding NtrC family response regulator
MFSMTVRAKDNSRRQAPQTCCDAGGEPVVLVVENDRKIRHLICTLLRHTIRASVVEAADPHAAIAAARRASGPIELLISDINLSAVMNGIDLARQLVVSNPSMKVLLMSAADRPPRDIPATWRFLEKPFSMQDFLGCVDALCETSATPCAILLTEGARLNKRGLRRQ